MVPQWLTRVLMLVLLVVAAMSMSGCEAIAGIFKAGMWVGILGVVIVIAVIGFIASAIRG